MKKHVLALCGLLVLAAMVSACGLFDEDENGVNMVHPGGVLSEDEVWVRGTHLVTGNITVSASLTISPCAVIKSEDNIIFQVSDGGSIKSLGTADCPVTFTSAKAAPAAGDWKRIDIHDSASNDNVFTYTNFRYGGDNYGVLWVDADASVSVDHCSFSHIEEEGVVIGQGADIGSFSNNSFDHVGMHLIDVAVDIVPFIGPITSANNNHAFVMINAGTTEDDGTWQDIGVPFHAENLSLQGAIVFDPGVTLLMDPGSGIDVSDGGSLKLMGTELNHVTIGSAKSAPAAGDWGEIDIYDSSSNDSEFHYTDIQHGGDSGSYGALCLDDGVTITLDNVSFIENDECDISGDGTVTATASPYDLCQ